MVEAGAHHLETKLTLSVTLAVSKHSVAAAMPQSDLEYARHHPGRGLVVDADSMDKNVRISCSSTGGKPVTSFKVRVCTATLSKQLLAVMRV